MKKLYVLKLPGNTEQEIGYWTILVQCSIFVVSYMYLRGLLVI